MRILVVEDNDGMRQGLATLLKKNQYLVDQAYDGISGLEYATNSSYNLIILDIIMPGISGIDVLRNIRSLQIFTPVLLLTTKSSVTDIARGLDLGADDYLTKPFSTTELLARVRALCRRKGTIESDSMEYMGLILDTKTGELIFEEERIPLGNKELNIMRFLIANPNHIISKEMLIDKVWGYESNANDNNIEVYISFIRKKLVLIGSPVEIHTSRGLGYSLRLKKQEVIK